MGNKARLRCTVSPVPQFPKLQIIASPFARHCQCLEHFHTHSLHLSQAHEADQFTGEDTEALRCQVLPEATQSAVKVEVDPGFSHSKPQQATGTQNWLPIRIIWGV